MVEDDGFAWLFTGIYGEPRMELKHRTWKLLRDLHGQRDMSWLCVGDFNEILHHHEKEGGAMVIGVLGDSVFVFDKYFFNVTLTFVI